MTIDEAIKDLEYGIEQLEMEIKSGLWIKGSEPELSCKEGIALNKQYIEWLTELKEAKRLLKVAVEDIHELLHDKRDLDGDGQSCNICSYIEWCSCCKECTIREDLRNWRYADEALKLIEEGGDI